MVVVLEVMQVVVVGVYRVVGVEPTPRVMVANGIRLGVDLVEEAEVEASKEEVVVEVIRVKVVTRIEVVIKGVEGGIRIEAVIKGVEGGIKIEEDIKVVDIRLLVVVVTREVEVIREVVVVIREEKEEEGEVEGGVEEEVDEDNIDVFTVQRPLYDVDNTYTL